MMLIVCPLCMMSTMVCGPFHLVSSELSRPCLRIHTGLPIVSAGMVVVAVLFVCSAFFLLLVIDCWVCCSVASSLSTVVQLAFGMVMESFLSVLLILGIRTLS